MPVSLFFDAQHVTKPTYSSFLDCFISTVSEEAFNHIQNLVPNSTPSQHHPECVNVYAVEGFSEIDKVRRYCLTTCLQCK